MAEIDQFRIELQEASKAVAEFRKANEQAAQSKENDTEGAVVRSVTSSSNRGQEDFSAKIVAAIEKQGNDAVKMAQTVALQQILATLKWIGNAIPGVGELVADVKTLLVSNKAQDEVASLAAEAAKSGVGLSDVQIQQEFAAQQAAEARAEAARIRVEALTGGDSAIGRIIGSARASQAGR